MLTIFFHIYLLTVLIFPVLKLNNLCFSCARFCLYVDSERFKLLILLLPLVGLPLILPSIILCKSLSCLKTCPTRRCFHCQMKFSICLFSFTVLRTSSLVYQASYKRRLIYKNRSLTILCCGCQTSCQCLTCIIVCTRRV